MNAACVVQDAEARECVVNFNMEGMYYRELGVKT